jgi:cysteine-rich repeat protein
VLGLVALIIVMSGVAVAAIPGPGQSGTISACYNDRSGALRVIDPDAGEACNAAKESAVAIAAVDASGRVADSDLLDGRDSTDFAASDQSCSSGDYVTGISSTGELVCGKVPVCGDTVQDPGETCDDGGESAACDLDCTASVCGDGVVNQAAGEQCDTGAATASCDLDCTAAFCGDGTTNSTAGEQCDDGNANDSDSCSNTCAVNP